jgi:RNA polymerase sigma-70 factor (ECF subfamily)
MSTTSLSLLEHLRRPDDQAAWNRFVDLYAPLLYYWARQTGLQNADAADLVQEVLHLLVNKLPEFEYDRQRSFRAWLRTVTLNKWREAQRKRQIAVAAGGSQALPEPAVPDTAQAFWETEYRQMLAARALEIMRAEFEPATWQACWETVVSGRPAAEVASELGLTTNAVYLARSRVLRRLRCELQGLLD